MPTLWTPLAVTAEAAYLRTLAIDEAFTRTDSTGTFTYLADALGSTVALTDQTGTTATSYTYAPFGETSVSGLPSSSPFQFTGRENDGTGLYYYRARYYDSRQGRFISEDPVGTVGISGCRWTEKLLVSATPRTQGVDLMNLYAYVRNRPTMLSDPSGLGPCEDDWLTCQQRAKSRNVECVGSVMTAYLACAAGAMVYCAGKGPLAVQCLATVETACAASGALMIGACTSAYVAELSICTYEYARCKVKKRK